MRNTFRGFCTELGPHGPWLEAEKWLIWMHSEEVIILNMIILCGQMYVRSTVLQIFSKGFPAGLFFILWGGGLHPKISASPQMSPD